MPPKQLAPKRQSPRKPLIERRRRQRINESLCQIRQLIPRARELELKRGGKLEKAEVLEIAVQFIRETVQAREVQAAVGNKAKAHNKERKQEELQGETSSQIMPYRPNVEDSNFSYEESWNYGLLSQRPAANFFLHPRVYRPIPRHFTPTICYSTTHLNTLHAFPKALPSVLAEGLKTEDNIEAKS